MKKHNNFGFTVVELLVCIAIIAVLASIMLSASSGAMKQAKQSVCISNLRQIYTALKLYQSDFGEYPLPSLGHPMIQPYYPTPLHCPLATNKHYALDYLPVFNMLVHPEHLPNSPQMYVDFLACREKRGPAMPLVADKNHIDRSVTKGPVPVLREAGNVDIVKVNGNPPTVCRFTTPFSTVLQY